MVDDKLNESIDGLDGEDTSGQLNMGQGDYSTEPIAVQDTDLVAEGSARERLLLRLYEATDKDFGAHETSELRSIWKAYCEDQEVSDAVELQHPSVSLVYSPGTTH